MKDDKKKLVILGVLAVVILGVGGFTMMGGGASAPAPTESKPKTEETADTGGKTGTTTGEEAKVGEVGPDGKLADGTTPVAGAPEQFAGLQAVNDLLPRDPFQAPAGFKGSKPTPPPTPQPAPVKPPTTRGPKADPGMKPWSPGPLAGNVPDGGSPLPSNLPVTPTYKVKGVLLGAKPIVVIEDSNGGQKLVPLGGSIDGDTQVTGIRKGSVTIRHKGKETTLTIEEEASNG